MMRLRSAALNPLVIEKLDQAVAILRDLEIDAWLTFVRETSAAGDPVLPLILDHGLTWQSALIVTRGGDRIALVGNYDADIVRRVGGWNRVESYVQGISEPLRRILLELAPQKLAVNFSCSNVMADGLTHGMWLLLQEYLAGTPLADRIVSAEPVLAALRGRKSPAEVERIRRAVSETEEILDEIGAFLAVGRSEREVAGFAKERLARRGLAPAWDPAACPIVNTGPQSRVGHAGPTDLRIEPGHAVHIDFGVRRDGYCSDLQRMWYVPRRHEQGPPAGLQRALEATVAAIEAAAKALRPGAECWQVDEAARRCLTSFGFPEYQHGTGHHIGRSVHDGGGSLGPRWERYGRTPYYLVEPGNVFTLELGVYDNPEHGAVGLEEDVLVTDQGVEWLSRPQQTFRLVR